MATHDATTPGARTGVRSDGFGKTARRRATETKQSIKTSEFWAFVAVVLAILVSAMLIKGGDSGGTDEFIARQAWLYVAIVTGAYMISRGLAKSGSQDPYTDDAGDGDRNQR
jgi:hypothetical protein